MLKTRQPKHPRKPSSIFLGLSRKSFISVAERGIESLPTRRYFLHQNRALPAYCVGTSRAKGSARWSLPERWAASPWVGEECCPAGLTNPREAREKRDLVTHTSPALNKLAFADHLVLYLLFNLTFCSFFAGNRVLAQCRALAEDIHLLEQNNLNNTNTNRLRLP